ncbi:unnamed protein product [Oikopleura dioica]|uniref:Uncharacterized protein n=1 Tax=Oikopleura dioica TaxID=34765 RepID=E4WTL3_OIKDI|nr:unnamed protein product [Oikopleura dioica]
MRLRPFSFLTAVKSSEVFRISKIDNVVRALVEEQLCSILNCRKSSDLRNRVPALSGLIGSENFYLRRIGRKPKIQEDLSNSIIVLNLPKINEEELHLRISQRDDQTAEEICLKIILLQDQKIEQQRRIISSLDSQIDGLLAPSVFSDFDDELFDIQKKTDFIESRIRQISSLLTNIQTNQNHYSSMRRSATLTHVSQRCDVLPQSTKNQARWPSMNNLRPSFSENLCISKLADSRDSDSDTGFSSLSSSDNEYHQNRPETVQRELFKAETLV